MLKKLICLTAAALLAETGTVCAQSNFSEYAGYYGETGPDDQTYNYDGNPVIYVFYNNEPCDSCAEAINLIEQAYNQNWQGIYDFYII